MAKKIQICMGSACHLKGSPLIAQALQVKLERREKAGEVIFELLGSFCQSQCADGVIVKVNGETYKHVTVADVPSLINICLQED